MDLKKSCELQPIFDYVWFFWNLFDKYNVKADPMSMENISLVKPLVASPPKRLNGA